MGSESLKPGLRQTYVDDLEQGPHRPLWQPRVCIGLEPGRRRNHVADKPTGRRELNVGADTVRAPRRRAEVSAESLSEPALHSARRDGDDVCDEWVARAITQGCAERVDQAVGSLSSMDVKQRGPVL